MKKINLLLILVCLNLLINAQITTYPYSEGFETGAGGWIENNTTNGLWALGTPAVTVINSAASGTNSWVTNFTRDYNIEESSKVTSPLNFITKCAVLTPDYIEDFTTIPVGCWDEADSGDATTGPGDIGTGSWVEDGYLNDGSTGAYKINFFIASKSDWLLSPSFDLTGGPFQVEFDLGVMQLGSLTNAGTLGSDDIIQLLITTDAGASWTVLQTWDSTFVFPSVGTHPVNNLSTYSGQTVQFGILGSEGTVNDPEEIDVFVDNFQLRAVPSCPDVANLTFDSVTATTANLSWDVSGGETGWEVVVQALGTGIPTSAGTATTDNEPYVATGLNPVTDYEVFVRSVCGSDFGSWTGLINFSTDCVTFIVPYTEGFENGGTIPECWTMDGGEDWNFNNTPPDFSNIGNDGTIIGNTATNEYFAWVDASGNDAPTTLTSPFVDVSTLTAPTLSFYLISDNEGNANSQLEVEVWDGASWISVGTYNSNTNGWEEIFIDLSGLTITGDVQVRFIFSEPVTPDFYDDIAIDDVSFGEPPTCFKPKATYTIVDDCANGNQFLVDVDVTFFGGATSISIVDNQGSTLVSIAATGVTQLGPYPLNTDVIFTVSNELDTCFATSQPITTPACPPSNDNCSNPIMVTANADINGTNFVSATMFGATPSPETNACTGTPNDDVWFTFTAINTEHVVSLGNIAGPTTFLSHGLYEGTDCNNLTNLYCSTETGSVANGLTIGNKYYVRIYSFGDVPFQDVNFDLRISSVPPPITTTLLDEVNGDNDDDDDIYSIQGLVEDVLVNSPCSTISNVTFSTGINFDSDNGIGYFEANGSGFPFDSGIIMTTGNVANAPGPETGTLSDGSINWPGDGDLEAEINEGDTYNASVIEFDFVPSIENMSFEFIFAAEEYGSFQCSFKDAFAFLLTDTVTGTTTNLAVVPGTTTPVSVFSIRDMTFNTTCSSVNETLFGAYYGAGGLPAATSPTNFIGRTVPLAATSTVVPNRTYRIKLVIADAKDTAYDSAVFLKAGSFDIGEVDLGEDILLTSGNASCEGIEVTLDVGVNISSNATISWYTIDESSTKEPVLDEDGMPENGLTLGVTESNTYQVEIVLNNNSSCVITDTIVVEFFPNPITPDNLPDILGCDTDNSGMAIFDLTENDTQIQGSQTGTNISYYLTEQDAIDATNPITNPTTYQSAPIIIHYRIEDDETGCYSVNTFNLVLAPKPVLVQADNIVSCDDEDGISNYDLTINEAVITNNQTGFTFTYHSTLADAETSMNAIANPSNFNGGVQTIFVRVENASNGCFKTTTLEITLGISPMTSFDSSIIYEVCPNATVPIIVTATGDNYTASEVSIQWFYDGVLISGQTDLTLDTVLLAGDYEIESTFNDTGCSSRELVTVLELETCIIPQGISPNGDGLNDTFDLSSYDVQKLTIFNRYGVKVFEKTSYTNEWLGQSLAGDELPSGTYYYVMKYQGNKTKASWVYINRENN